MSELKKKTAVNIGVNGIAVIVVSALQFLSSIVLARLLLPTDYGIVGFALIFINLMANFSDFGIGSALIQKANADDNLMHTGFTLKILVSVFAFVTVFSLAPVSRILNESREIVSAIRMFSFGFLISIFAFPSQISLIRELRYKELAYPQIIGAVANSLCAIALAYSGFGYRSIIAGYLANTLITAALLNLIHPVRPHLRYDKESAQHILKFGSHLLLPAVITFLIFNADNFTVGALRGSEQLGYYAIAFNLGTFVCLLLSGIIHQVLFPTFSKFQHDLMAMKAAYLDSVKYVAFVAVPVNLFLIVLGKEFLYYVLGGCSGRWLPALATLQILCIYGVFRALLEPLANVITGIGKPRLFIRTSLIVAALQLLLLYPAIRFGGIEAVAVVVTVSYLSQYVVCVRILRQEIDVGVAEVLEAVRPAFLAFVVALPAVLFLKMLFEPSLFVLMGEVLLGITAYLIIYGMLTQWQLIKEVREFVRHSG